MTTKKIIVPETTTPTRIGEDDPLVTIRNASDFNNDMIKRYLSYKPKGSETPNELSITDILKFISVSLKSFLNKKTPEELDELLGADRSRCLNLAVLVYQLEPWLYLILIDVEGKTGKKPVKLSLVNKG